MSTVESIFVDCAIGLTVGFFIIYGIPHIYAWFKTAKRPPPWVKVDGSGKVTPVSETPEGRLFMIVGLQGKCPDCGHTGFYAGPQGGMSQNIFCMNRDCRSGFNLTFFDQRNGTVERISQGDLRRYPDASQSS